MLSPSVVVNKEIRDNFKRKTYKYKDYLDITVIEKEIIYPF